MSKINKSVTKKGLEGVLKPSGKLVARKISTYPDEAIRVSDSSIRSSEADVLTNGSVSLSIQGISSEGESGTLETCFLLIQRINQLGANWSEPYFPDGPETGIDCESKNNSEILQIQVTRIPKEALWKQLGQAGNSEARMNIDDAAKDILDSIRHKESIPYTDRSNIVLAINAMDTSSYATNAVVNTFLNNYRKEANDLGFKSIWIVGPTVELVKQLVGS